MRTEFGKDNRGGLTVGIFENGRLAWTNAYGFANEKAKIRATDDTIYPVASLTKMITGFVLLQLVERGKVHLADPVERYVPEFKKIPKPVSMGAASDFDSARHDDLRIGSKST
jgi:CubicO group peptidase (beta-lactamase class C family)